MRLGVHLRPFQLPRRWWRPDQDTAEPPVGVQVSPLRRLMDEVLHTQTAGTGGLAGGCKVRMGISFFSPREGTMGSPGDLLSSPQFHLYFSLELFCVCCFFC